MAQDPRTPTSSSPFRPHTSSPLSESFSPSPSTSAAAKLQSRRRAQYKSTASATPPRRVSSAYSSRPQSATVENLNFGVRLFSPVSPSGDAYPRSALLRDRLRQRFARRAQQAREKRVEQKRERRKHGLSSDGEEMSMDSDENDEDVEINDELFRRIIASASHRSQHSYRLSFQNEVGSSLDPDMEETAEWERVLQVDGVPPIADELALLPSEFDEEEIAELAAQAEEDELWAHLEANGFGDIPPNPQIPADEDVMMT